MGKLTANALHKGDLSITGSSNASGGIYDHVKIIGEGTIEGDVECNSLKCVGTMEMDGRLQSGSIKIVGTCQLSSDVKSDLAKISGTASFGGNASLKQLHCAGTIEIRGNLTGEILEVKGQLNTQGDCEAESFVGRGIFEIGGLLNAEQLDIKLYRNCRAKEIGGGRIRIRKASSLNPFSFFFRPASHAVLDASVIEGDEVYLENTRARVVRGNRVTIGRNCEIEHVEYKEYYEQARDTVVKENRKV